MLFQSLTARTVHVAYFIGCVHLQVLGPVSGMAQRCAQQAASYAAQGALDQLQVAEAELAACTSLLLNLAWAADAAMHPQTAASGKLSCSLSSQHH